MSSEEFLTILRLSESQEELQATKNLLQSEMHNLVRILLDESF